MIEDSIRPLLESLGIGTDYGLNPPRPRHAEPPELIDVGPNIVGTPQRLTPGTAESWSAMRAAAANDGVELLLVSGFRSVGYQAELIARKLAGGISLTSILEITAAPGFSQHHTGQTIDIATRGARPLTEDFDATAAFSWLSANATNFGFRMPYGRGNRFGFAYEPWHWTQLDD